MLAAVVHACNSPSAGEAETGRYLGSVASTAELVSSGSVRDLLKTQGGQ